jgi:Homeodomain-like domain
MKKYKVTPTAEERQQLPGLIATGQGAAQKLTHARIPRKADATDGGPAWDDQRLADAVEVRTAPVARVRPRFVEHGLEAARARTRQARPSRERKLGGRAEARLIALACSAPPDGHKRWTMKPLADRLVELEVVEAVSDGTVRRALKKNEIKPWLRGQWRIPPEADAAFVAAMEVYHRPDDQKRPLVALDEASKQVVGAVVQPLPPEPGQPERLDYE